MIFVACAFSSQVYAQLEVQTSGSVKISRNLSIGTAPNSYIFLNISKTGPVNETPTYGIKSEIIMPACPVYSFYSVYGLANAQNSSALHYPFPVIGVYGEARKKSSYATLAAGVLGLANNNGGVGIFGCIGNIPTAPISASAKYAGYFKGSTMVNGTLLANTIVLNGDTLHLNNIRSLSREANNSLTQLQPVSYSFKPDSSLQYDEKLQQEMEGTHYGFVAQDVQKIFPELVYERDGNLSVNYIEMIPLLLQEIKKLSAEVEELKKQVK